MRARPSCPHGHLDTCAPCGAAAHLHAVRHAVVVGISCPDDDEAQDLADLAVADALAAQKGHRILRAHAPSVRMQLPAVRR